MTPSQLLAGLSACLVGAALGQTKIDGIGLSGSSLTSIEVGAASYPALTPPTGFVDNKDGTDYLHVAANPPASLAEAIGGLDVSSGSLNHPFEVQFDRALYGNTLVYLLINENDSTPNDTATVYPIDADGNRLGGVSAALSFPSLGAMPVLDTSLYNRTTDGTADGTLNRLLVGVAFTLDDLGIGGLPGTEGLEFETSTLDPQEIGLADLGSLVDPRLVQDLVTADPDLDFGLEFLGSGAPAETAVRTVRFTNTGPTRSLRVDTVTLDGDFVVTDLALNATGGQMPPLVLGVGDALSVSVKGVPSRTGPLPFRGTLRIDTEDDTQDQVLTATATLVGPGDGMNANPSFVEGGAAATGWSQSHLRVSPGLTPNASHALRIYGTGDPGGESIGQANQVTGIPDGATDFESVFVFTPVRDFSTYAGVEADGGFTDRSMQYLLLATNESVSNGNGMTEEDTDNVLVNLAYMPDGVTAGGTPGLYVYDGDAASWELAVAVELQGSIDADGDGVLDPATGDTVEAYRVSIAASGFGAPGASYVVSVSTVGPGGLSGSFTSGPLTSWHGISGESATLAGHSFTSGDQSDSNLGAGLTTPFWIDTAAIHYAAQSDAALTLIATPDILRADGDVSPVGTGSLAIRNDGDDDALSIDAFQFADPAFSVSGPLPVVLAPGTSEVFDVEWNSSAAPGSAAIASVTIESSDPSPIAPLELLAALSSTSALNPNFDFEVPGRDPEGDTDTFVFWAEGTNVQDVPGLLAGSATGAHVNGNSTLGTSFIRQDPLWTGGDAWVARAVFAIGGTDNRVFNFKVREELDGENYTEVNLRYEADKWQVFNGIPNVNGGGDWVDLLDLASSPLQVSEDADDNGSLDDPDDVKVPYVLEVSGRGWSEGSTPVFDFELFDAAGTLIGSATARTELLNGFVPEDLPRSGPNYLEMRSTGPDFWVDDVVISGADGGPGVRILGVSGGPGGLTILYDAGGAPVNIERSSPGLGDFSDIATGESSGSFTDSSAPAGRAFYRVYLAE